MLNRFDRPSPMAGEAEVKYLDGDFRIIRPGAFVRCAVTGVPIPLEELKYWSVELQEPYASPEAVMRRHFPLTPRVTACSPPTFPDPPAAIAGMRSSSSSASVTGSARARAASAATSGLRRAARDPFRW